MKISAALFVSAVLTAAPAWVSAEPVTQPNNASVVRLDHVAMRVSNLDTTIEFYRQAFGFDVKTRWDSMTLGSGENAQTVKMTGAMLQDDAGGIIEIFGDGDAEQRQPYQQPINHFGLNVTDIEAVYNNALKAGATAVTPPTEVNARGMGATIAFVLGPDSERVELIQYAK